MGLLLSGTKSCCTRAFLVTAKRARRGGQLARPEMEHFMALGDVAADHLADDDGEVVDAAKLLAYVRVNADVTREDVVRMRGMR